MPPASAPQANTPGAARRVLVDREAAQRGRDSGHGLHGHVVIAAPDGRARLLGGLDHLGHGPLAHALRQPLVAAP